MLFYKSPEQFILPSPNGQSEAYQRAQAAFETLVPEAAQDFLSVAADIAAQIVIDEEDLSSDTDTECHVEISEQYWSEIACMLESKLSRRHQLSHV